MVTRAEADSAENLEQLKRMVVDAVTKIGYKIDFSQASAGH